MEVRTFNLLFFAELFIFYLSLVCFFFWPALRPFGRNTDQDSRLAKKSLVFRQTKVCVFLPFCRSTDGLTSIGKISRFLGKSTKWPTKGRNRHSWVRVLANICSATYNVALFKGARSPAASARGRGRNAWR